MSAYVTEGRGAVPATGLLAAAWRELTEFPGKAMAHHIAELKQDLQFTDEGLTFDKLEACFTEALGAARKVEAIVESGNKYSVCKQFEELNGTLLLEQLRRTDLHAALRKEDRARADKFLEFVCQGQEGSFRNRNPLHPNPLDSWVIGTLCNFPKHIFQFPYACYATNGNEAISLVLFAYRAECSKGACVYHLVSEHSEDADEVRDCCTRLSMPSKSLRSATELNSVKKAAVLIVDIEHPNLKEASAWAAKTGTNLHVHVSDRQLLLILAHPTAVHVDLPATVRSVTINSGFFNTAFSLYKDAGLRSYHFDLPYHWQSQYVSPNEGGSGTTAPLFFDLCMVLLGWKALSHAAAALSSKIEARGGRRDLSATRLHPLLLDPLDPSTIPVFPGNEDDLDKMAAVLKQAYTDSTHLSRRDLEHQVVTFQRQFTGALERPVEALITGGGTRSINLAFESVLQRARADMSDKQQPGIAQRTLRVLTGNPHLAVERAGRRFLFDVTRLHRDREASVLCPRSVREAVKDPAVIAVYAQTLSITDGITDPLAEIVAVLNEENQARKERGMPVPVTLINDCCLALSILIHNDGREGRENYRVLELTAAADVTPTIVTLDAHKHIGADKGISMVIGTKGTLSWLEGAVKVGTQPTDGHLVCAMADMRMVGYKGYQDKYFGLASAIETALTRIEAAGGTIVHKHNRRKGSTAFGFEDPRARVIKLLKKKGHGPAPLFKICPEQPQRCQTGFLLSLTPHSLRPFGPDKRRALDVFVEDAVECHQLVQRKPARLAKLFREDRLIAVLLAGGAEESWSFSWLHHPGPMRNFWSMIFRCVFTAIADCGTANSHKQPHALRSVAVRGVLFGAVAGGAFMAYQSRK